MDADKSVSNAIIIDRNPPFDGDSSVLAECCGARTDATFVSIGVAKEGAASDRAENSGVAANGVCGAEDAVKSARALVRVGRCSANCSPATRIDDPDRERRAALGVVGELGCASPASMLWRT
jgi:hypothetical protein